MENAKKSFFAQNILKINIIIYMEKCAPCVYYSTTMNNKKIPNELMEFGRTQEKYTNDLLCS